MVLVDTERRSGSQDGLPIRSNAACIVSPEATALDEIVEAARPLLGQTLQDASLLEIFDKAIDFPRLRQLGADLADSDSRTAIQWGNDGLVRRSGLLPSNKGLCFLVGVKQEGDSSQGIFLSYERKVIEGVEEVRISDQYSRRTVRVVRSPKECQVYLSVRERGQAAKRTGTVFIRCG